MTITDWPQPVSPLLHHSDRRWIADTPTGAMPIVVQARAPGEQLRPVRYRGRRRLGLLARLARWWGRQRPYALPALPQASTPVPARAPVVPEVFRDRQEQEQLARVLRPYVGAELLAVAA